MPSRNLWGDIGSLEPIRTPTTVLQEQASALSEATQGVLRGKVEVETRGDAFVIGLSIVAPALLDYEYQVVRVRHGIGLYPATVSTPSGPGKDVECQDEEGLTAVLGSILGSAQTGTVIRSLVSQSKAM